MSLFSVSGTHYLGIPYWILAVIAFIALLAGATMLYPPTFTIILTWIFILAPFWAPPVLLILAWNQWKKYIRAKFISEQTPVLIEIKIPRQIVKTPRAMELVFANLHVGPGETTFISRWWEGKVRPWWSLELVSIEGKVHFYIWMWEKYREFIESQLYAQFPDIEIHEVEDYTSGVHYDPKLHNVWGMEYVLGKADAYPIKTYIDFELDKEAHKSEQIIDPLSGVFERFSTLGKGEQLWVQIMVRKNGGATKRPSFWEKAVSWKDETKAEIEKIYNDAKPESTNVLTGDIGEGYPLLKPAEVNTIKALERSIEKPGFDAGMRAIYITRPDSFRGHQIPTHVVGLWNSLASGYLNKFVPGDTWHVSLDYPWEDFRNMRIDGFSRDIIDAYHRRSLFHPPYEHSRFVLTSEELATIYHFPTEETQAPGVERIPSVKGGPPANLPT